MAVDWRDVFDNFGVKTVSNNDRQKGAYVPNRAQRKAIEAAGVQPQQGAEFAITVLGDPTIRSVKASYYYSQRSAAANRPPEPRMGHELISSYLNPGDDVLIGNVGTEVFAVKLAAAPATTEAVVAEAAKKTVDKEGILKRAKKAAGKPARRAVTRNDFVRDPWVVAGALIRADGKCEVPGCTCALFNREDDAPYLEVHHVLPLGEEGEDSLANAAAICPHHHRELHHGKNRMALRETLAAHITAKTAT